MYTDIQELLQRRAELLCSGRFEELTTYYHLPFVGYHDGVPVFVETPSEGVEALSKIAALMTARGAVRLDVEVSSVELPRDGRFRVWCRYSEVAASGEIVSQSHVVQYLVETPRGPLVEMMESRRCPLAKIWGPEDSLAS